ncbi:glutamate--cysteine ligase [Ectothiorhodospiraceae bacterium WFHF3C12]|nr:glutamate--cysteine ligase [Ectothiorhodospiraceae bacterium WFHF3C12]
MNDSAERRVRNLQLNGERALLRGSRRGLEKESLRVTRDGKIALTPHPEALGSALCHPWITTDYSEALLEFVTPPYTETDQLLGFLDELHRYTYANIGDELLWATSMPCIVGGEQGIPIAEYGDSNVGRMKHIYRRGLDWRYGRTMQAISGIHFNYSFSDEFLAATRAAEGDERSEKAHRSDLYFRLIRNFQRFGWLVPYLFGASPAICKSFTGGENLHFREFGRHTFYEPYGTSLRMSDIGYKNKAQAGLTVSYNDVDAYIDSLKRAISTPDPEYARIGTEVDGFWRQLNANVLQIENEYYSFSRPKAVARSGEKPTTALRRAGVEYVEIRALDLNPFEPLGTSVRQLEFMETLLLFCLLRDSPPIDAREQGRINCNQGLVARQGREPGLELYRGDGRRVTLRSWARELFDAMAGPAELLDEIHDEGRYTEALRQLRERIEDPALTPSAQVLEEMDRHGEEFVQFAMRISEEHEQYFKAAPLPEQTRQRFDAEARTSLEEQRRIEAGDDLPFEEYLRRYFAQP